MDIYQFNSKRRFAFFSKFTKKIHPAVVFVLVLLIAISFFFGWFFGKQNEIRHRVPEGEGQLINRQIDSSLISDDIDFDLFWQAWNIVKEVYYKQPVSDKDLYYGAVRGMVAATEDPYTVFFDPEEAKAFQDNINGSFEGIGAEIGIRDEQLQVIAPLPSTPAEKAGLTPGDKIVLIDQIATTGMTIEEAVMKIRGEKGTTVVLGIVRDKVEGVSDVPIVRETIKIDSLKWEITDDNIALINLYTFNSDTTALFNDAVNEILTTDVKGIILDLRSNPGGLLRTAIDIASAWVGYDIVLIEKMPNNENTFRGQTAPRFEGIPTVVLVNGGSASASEIVAGALQDHGLAKIIGTKTYGKGSVQDYRDLSDGSAVKVTIAQWFTPSGRVINEKGIEPDETIEFTLDDYNAKQDPQKQKAIETIEQAQN
ncbi:MAG: S41 family peptidase [Patescibacteria group bacterium]